MSKVIIDPGHGGLDPGAIGPSGIQEKIVALGISRHLRDVLSSYGLEVILTRDCDCDVGLNERARMANNYGANLFISVHCNAAVNQAAHGLEAWHWVTSEPGRECAEKILDGIVLETGLANRGLKFTPENPSQLGLGVLRMTKMTAVLVECGFLSNPTEEGLLETSSFQEKCARGIARGVMKFLGLAIKEKENMFKDVNPKAWYAGAVETVARAGLMGGYQDGTFRPEGYLTRAELASALSRYLYRDGVFTDILPDILPAVVRVSHSHATGSGVSIGGGRILTCAHVVSGAEKETMTVDTYKGRVTGRYLIASAVPGEDLALIKIDADLPAIKLAPAVAAGVPVAVIGSPLGIRQAVTVGVVSALGIGEYGQFVQIDAPINPGNSGGPVVNEKGELAGIATAKVVGTAIEGVGYMTSIAKINAFLGRV